MRNMELYLDLDGVLANFFAKSKELFGKEDASYLQWYFWKDWGISAKEFWDAVSADKTFWESLEPYWWTDSIISATRYYDPEFKIITAPQNCPNSYYGKAKWVQTHLDLNLPKRCIFTHEKHLLSGEGRVLIDDCEKNITKWVDAGGIGLLFPSVINYNKEYVGRELEFVLDHLRLLNKTMKGL